MVELDSRDKCSDGVLIPGCLVGSIKEVFVDQADLVGGS